MEKQTFILTKADIELLNLVQADVPSGWLYPPTYIAETMKAKFAIVWKVLGEKHGFNPKSAEKHPEGEPKILATPTKKLS